MNLRARSIYIINGLQYRLAAYAGISTQFAWGFMNILLFHAFYSENPANFPMQFEQFAAYTWLNQALLAMIAVWFWDRSIFDDITNGILKGKYIQNGHAVVFTLAFDADGGTETGPRQVYYGYGAERPEDPVKAHFDTNPRSIHRQALPGRPDLEGQHQLQRGRRRGYVPGRHGVYVLPLSLDARAHAQGRRDPVP